MLTKDEIAIILQIMEQANVSVKQAEQLVIPIMAKLRFMAQFGKGAPPVDLIATPEGLPIPGGLNAEIREGDNHNG